ncbi:MAG: gliding motility-associated C-terminal domain-containing protein [Bacteroidota bacterium]
MKKLFFVVLLMCLGSATYGQCFEQGGGNLQVEPPLPAGGYALGTAVEMCFVLNEFFQDEAEWVHAIVPEFGPGWEVSTLVPTQTPIGCSEGNWNFYNDWTSCTTQEGWGPGFTFESGSGVACNGTPNDSEPGNNYGDAGNCPRRFCWQIVAGANPNSGCEEDDYLVSVNVYGDARTGSYVASSACDDPAYCWPQLTDFQAFVNAPCPGDPFTLTGIAEGLDCSTSASWSGPDGFSTTDLVFNTMVEGTYTFTVERGGPCDSYEEVVEVFYGDFNPTLNVDSISSYCFGETVTLAVDGGVNFTFLDPTNQIVQQGADNTYTFTATDMTAGEYTIQVNGSSASCVSTLTAEIIVFPSLDTDVELASDAVCAGEEETFTIANFNPDFTYSWDGGLGSGQSYTVGTSIPGSYNMLLQVCNQGGCCETFQIPYEVLPLPVINILASAEDICRGDAVTLTASGGDSYLWSPTGDTDPMITDTPDTITTYGVLVTNAAGCSASDSLEIVVRPVLGAPEVSCESNSAATLSFDWPLVLGADYYEVFIDGVFQGNIVSPPLNLDGLSPLQEVTIRVVPFSNDNVGCPGEETELTCQVRGCEPVDLTIDPIDPICASISGDFIPLFADDDSLEPGIVTWSGPNVVTTTNPGRFDPNGLAPGIYTLTATFILLDGTCGFSETIDVEILESAPADLVLSDSLVCVDVNAIVELAGASVPTAIYNWDYDGAEVLNGTGAGPYTLGFPAEGDYTITLQADLGTCSDIDSITVTALDTLVPPTVFCQAVTTNSVTFGWTDVGANSYTVIVLDGPTGTINGNSYEVTGLNNGDEVTIQVIANSTGECPAASSETQTCEAFGCPDVTITIDNESTRFCNNKQNDAITLTSTVTGAVNPSDVIYAGPGVTNNIFDPDDAGVGVHTLTATVFDQGCPFTAAVIMEVLALPSSTFTITPEELCVNQTTMVEYTGGVPFLQSDFQWDFGDAQIVNGMGEGPFEVEWDSGGDREISLIVEGPNGCVSEETIRPAEVQNPLTPPEIQCALTDLDQIVFLWDPVPGAVGYEVTILGGLTTVQNDVFFTADGLDEGQEVTIEVTAIGLPPCGDGPVATQTCRALSCDGLSVTPTLAQTNFCIGDGTLPIMLTADVVSATGEGDLGWSGPGVFEEYGLFFFDKQAAGLGTHTLTATYQENACIVQTSVDLIVNPIPEAFIFNLDNLDFGEVCEGEPFTVFYQGNAAPTATYDWDFGAADLATPQVDFETYELVFNTAGTFEVGLQVTQDGCTGTAAPYTVTVIPPIGSVDLTCNVIDLANISYTWSANPLATAYELAFNGEVFDTITALSFLADSLVPENTYTLTVTPLNADHPCGSGAPATVSCTTDPCPDLISDLRGNPEQICIDAAPVELTVDILNGSFIDSMVIWRGDGVSGSLFFPDVVGLGLHTVTMDYREYGPCPTKNLVEIEVIPQPQAEFMAVNSEACIDQEIEIVYTGNLGTEAVYDWDFGDAATVSGSGQGPYLVSWDSPGTKQVSLRLTANGCPGPADTLEVNIVAPLPAPVVTCVDADVQSVTFSWNPVPGALSYVIQEQVGGGISSQTGTTYTIDGLGPNETATISVQAFGGLPCGNGDAVIASCTTSACPSVIISPTTTTRSFCFGDDSAQVLLEATASGGSETGNFIWSGPGVSQVGDDFFFDPSSLPAGEVSLQVGYSENAACDYEGQLTMTINPLPLADAGADQTLTCLMGMVSLDGTDSESGPGYLFQWTHEDGDIIVTNPNDLMTDVGQSGRYFLQVTSPDGCISTDEVMVMADIEVPMPEIESIPVSCFGRDDGSILVGDVIGGSPPFTYSLNGQIIDTGGNFRDLSPGEYALRVTGANGCFSEFFLDINEPDELLVNLSLTTDPEDIVSGDELSVVANIFGGNLLDTLIWSPDTMTISEQGRIATFIARETTRVGLRVIDELGCVATGDLLIIVKENRPIYIPTGFSANGDNTNDRFLIYSDFGSVEEIESFRIYDRWGEEVFTNFNFKPNDPAEGWDGMHRGQALNPGVFVYQAVVRFSDGERVLYKGDVTLIK